MLLLRESTKATRNDTTAVTPQVTGSLVDVAALHGRSGRGRRIRAATGDLRDPTERTAWYRRVLSGAVTSRPRQACVMMELLEAEAARHLPSRKALNVVASAAVVVAVDWATKILAALTLDDEVIEIGSVLMLRLGHNPGVAFGLGDQLPGALVIAATALVTGVVTVSALRGSLGPPLAAGLVVGGTIANLGDRLVGGSVVDFLDLGWWPSFNVADIGITSGAALVMLSALRAPAPTRAPPSSSERPVPRQASGATGRGGDDGRDGRIGPRPSDRGVAAEADEDVDRQRVGQPRFFGRRLDRLLPSWRPVRHGGGRDHDGSDEGMELTTPG